MKNKTDEHSDENTSTENIPQSAADCGMEEAFGLGLLNDPSPPLKRQERAHRFCHSRTDVTKSPFLK